MKNKKHFIHSHRAFDHAGNHSLLWLLHGVGIC